MRRLRTTASRWAAATCLLLGLVFFQRAAATPSVVYSLLTCVMALRQDDRGPVRARIVPGPVVQILDVLIENATTHGTGEVTVSAQDAGTYVRLEVRDEGARTIGQEVFQRGTSVKDGGEGGLGLTIAAELATVMGGYLKLTPDPHTTFELLLPGPGPS